MEFTIDTEYYQQDGVGEIALLQLCGPIDQKSVPIFEAEIQELFKNDICRFVLDLSNTKYLNSSGLGLLINIAHKVNVVGGGIRLVNVAEKFRVLFDMLGLDSSLPIYENRDIALRSFGKGELRLKSGNAEQELEDSSASQEAILEDNPEVEDESIGESAPLLEEMGQEESNEDEDDANAEAIPLIKKKLPNLAKNLSEKQGSNLKFTSSNVLKSVDPSEIYEPESHVELEDDPDFELTGNLSALADKITDDGISSVLNVEDLDPKQAEQASEETIVEETNLQVEEQQIEEQQASEEAIVEEQQASEEAIVEEQQASEEAIVEEQQIEEEQQAAEESDAQELEEMSQLYSDDETETPQDEEVSISLIQKTFQPEEVHPDPVTKQQAHVEPVQDTSVEPQAESAPQAHAEPTQDTNVEPQVESDPQAHVEPETHVTPTPTAPVVQNTPPATKPAIQSAKPSARLPKVVQKPIEKTIQWYTAVEYYNQMKKGRTFPLTLQISRIDIVDGNREHFAKLKNTNVMFVPRFPGCQVVPEKVNLDMSKDNPRAEFWITPSTIGEIPGWVETLYAGQTSSFIKTPFKIKRYYTTFITFLLSIVVLLSYSWTKLDWTKLDFLTNYVSPEQRIWGHVGVAAIMLFSSFVLLKKSSPKVDVVEKLSRETMS